MYRKTALRISLLILLLLIGSYAGAQSVLDIVNQVSQTAYTHNLDDLLYTHTGDNRGIGGTQHDLARSNIYDQFLSYGLTTSLDPFTYSGSQYNNVIGVHQGTANPGEIYVVSAHYDSVSNPGADDDASGVAGMLEAARVMSQYNFEATVVFIAFDREEQGLIGSTAYVAHHGSDDVRGMVSMDMIAYNYGNTNTASIYGRTTSDPLKQSLSSAISLYGNGLVSVIGGDFPYSDHASFEAAGFEGALLIENGWPSNGNYHRATDTVDTAAYIDYSYATNMTRSTVGYLAGAARPVPEPGSMAAGCGGFVWIVVMIRGRRRSRQACETRVRRSTAIAPN